MKARINQRRGPLDIGHKGGNSGAAGTVQFGKSNFTNVKLSFEHFRAFFLTGWLGTVGASSAQVSQFFFDDEL